LELIWKQEVITTYALDELDAEARAVRLPASSELEGADLCITWQSFLLRLPGCGLLGSSGSPTDFKFSFVVFSVAALDDICLRTLA
jgi:hypothetical protein